MNNSKKKSFNKNNKSRMKKKKLKEPGSMLMTSHSSLPFLKNIIRLPKTTAYIWKVAIFFFLVNHCFDMKFCPYFLKKNTSPRRVQLSCKRGGLAKQTESAALGVAPGRFRWFGLSSGFSRTLVLISEDLWSGP